VANPPYLKLSGGGSGGNTGLDQRSRLETLVLSTQNLNKGI